MEKLYITHYYVHGTDPWQNIMLLPEKDAFRKAAELASAHEGMTSFGRFADFVNYYPLRKAADEEVREQFIRLGGQPELKHPYAFTLLESDYLKAWFGDGEELKIDIDRIPEGRISFTPGDSCALYSRGQLTEVLTLDRLLKRIGEADGSAEQLIRSIHPYGYIEAQLWFRPDNL